ncbi:hypothetical protein [Actinomadura geliboluensis]|uniref:hypothetical protein n=1 Tax=Actinomadura geliboluensis TaxID=882440 RepID=UPI00261317E6|nr:hypothetical protein [Actinomadura geliboluensis]
MSARKLRARLGLVDVVMLAGIAAGSVWLVLTNFTAIRPAAALMLAALAAVATFGGMSSGLSSGLAAPGENAGHDAPGEEPGGTTPGR